MISSPKVRIAFVVGADASLSNGPASTAAPGIHVMTVRRPAHGAAVEAMICYRIAESPSIAKRLHMPFELNARTARFLFALAALLLAAFSMDPARAGFPDRIIRIVVPFAPGGGTDVVARTLAQEMAKDLGASIVIENKPGAGTIIGTQAVAASEPDGYTLLMGTFANAVNPSLNAKLPYDPHKAFAPVALIARSFNIVVVNPDSPVRSIADLIAAAKADPDKLTYGTYGTGTSAHLAGELFKSLAKVSLTMVPYKGAAPAITDLLGGQIQVMFTTVASAAALIAGGQLRALAVTSAVRSPAFPDLPTVAEAGVAGYNAESWYGLFAPATTPADVIDRLNQSAARAVQTEAFKRLGVNEGLIMVSAPPQELDRYFRGEEERWRKVIQDAGIKVE
jgi:tripartite-type tricarboxylate transporter receptor subunit TctC